MFNAIRSRLPFSRPPVPRNGQPAAAGNVPAAPQPASTNFSHPFSTANQFFGAASQPQNHLLMRRNEVPVNATPSRIGGEPSWFRGLSPQARDNQDNKFRDLRERNHQTTQAYRNDPSVKNEISMRETEHHLNSFADFGYADFTSRNSPIPHVDGMNARKQVLSDRHAHMQRPELSRGERKEARRNYEQAKAHLAAYEKQHSPLITREMHLRQTAQPPVSAAMPPRQPSPSFDFESVTHESPVVSRASTPEESSTEYLEAGTPPPMHTSSSLGAYGRKLDEHMANYRQNKNRSDAMNGGERSRYSKAERDYAKLRADSSRKTVEEFQRDYRNELRQERDGRQPPPPAEWGDSPAPTPRAPAVDGSQQNLAGLGRRTFLSPADSSLTGPSASHPFMPPRSTDGTPMQNPLVPNPLHSSADAYADGGGPKEPWKMGQSAFDQANPGLSGYRPLPPAPDPGNGPDGSVNLAGIGRRTFGNPPNAAGQPAGPSVQPAPLRGRPPAIEPTTGYVHGQSLDVIAEE